MKKSVIIICGNLGSGKTSLIKELALEIPNYTPVILDEFRIKYSNGSILGETKAKTMMMREIGKQQNIILETTAFGQNWKNINLYFAKNQIKPLKVLLKCSKETSINRVNERGFLVPIPWKFNAIESVLKIHENLKAISNRFMILDSEKFTAKQLANYLLNHHIKTNAKTPFQ